MKDLVDFLNYEKDWRKNELKIIKNILDDEEKKQNLEILTKYFIPAIYAIWEGFFKESLVHFSDFINRNECCNGNLTLITQIINHKGFLDKKTNTFNSKRDILSNIQNIFKNPRMPIERPESKILNFKNSNDLLDNFNIKKLNRNYHSKLNKLERARSSIAHGEITIISSKEDIHDYIILISNLMDEVQSNILEAVNEINN